MIASELLNIVHEVRENSSWAVVLVPKHLYQNALIGFAALCDEDLCGRTIHWSDRPGKVTICYAGQDCPVPKGTPFDLYFSAWGESLDNDRTLAKSWIDKANRVSSSNSRNWDQTPVAYETALPINA
jgi:hypothetical protein